MMQRLINGVTGNLSNQIQVAEKKVQYWPPECGSVRVKSLKIVPVYSHWVNVLFLGGSTLQAGTSWRLKLRFFYSVPCGGNKLSSYKSPTLPGKHYCSGNTANVKRKSARTKGNNKPYLQTPTGRLTEHSIPLKWATSEGLLSCILGFFFAPHPGSLLLISSLFLSSHLLLSPYLSAFHSPSCHPPPSDSIVLLSSPPRLCPHLRVQRSLG